MAGFLEKLIPRLTTSVVQAEIPRSERHGGRSGLPPRAKPASSSRSSSSTASRETTSARSGPCALPHAAAQPGRPRRVRTEHVAVGEHGCPVERRRKTTATPLLHSRAWVTASQVERHMHAHLASRPTPRVRPIAQGAETGLREVVEPRRREDRRRGPAHARIGEAQADEAQRGPGADATAAGDELRRGRAERCHRAGACGRPGRPRTARAPTTRCAHARHLRDREGGGGQRDQLGAAERSSGVLAAVRVPITAA